MQLQPKVLICQSLTERRRFYPGKEDSRLGNRCVQYQLSAFWARLLGFPSMSCSKNTEFHPLSIFSRSWRFCLLWRNSFCVGLYAVVCGQENVNTLTGMRADCIQSMKSKASASQNVGALFPCKNAWHQMATDRATAWTMGHAHEISHSQFFLWEISVPQLDPWFLKPDLKLRHQLTIGLR